LLLEPFSFLPAVETTSDIETTLPVAADKVHTQNITVFDYYQTMNLHIVPNSAASTRTLQNLC
jgi:hypothetical protein